MGAQDRRPPLSIILRTVDGAWSQVGSGQARGIMAEGFTCSANEAGSDSCGFTLRRRSAGAWPDLIAFNQMEASVGGIPVWGGRIWEAPLSDTGDDTIAVAGRGWQYHLDDDLLQRMYVHTDLGGYQDQRSIPAASLTVHRAGPQAQTGSGVITITYPNGFASAIGDSIAVTIDLGAAVAKRVTVTWDRIGGADANTTLVSRGSTSADATVAGDDSSIVQNTSAGSTFSHTFAAARRYHHLMLTRAAGGTFAADQGVRISAVKIYAEAAYESGGASILKTSDVVKDVLASGALPLLDSSTVDIATTSFSIPDLDPGGYQTPRALIAAANAYEAKLIGVSPSRRLFLKTRSSIPLVEIGSWPGSSFQDSSTNTGDGLYNRVIVQGTGPDGSPINEVRTATSSLLTRQGFTRTAVLAVSAPMTTASAQAIGDVWLAEKSTAPLKGSVTITGYGGARLLSGPKVHPSELLLRTGQTLRIGHLIDPNTGGIGRDGSMRSVSYSHDGETATVELDNDRGRFEALMERLAVVTTQAIR